MPKNPSVMDPFKTLSKDHAARLKKIKMLALDVDGVMTDGRVLWIEGTGWTRMFSVKDGHGLKLLMQAGIEVAMISGGNSKSVEERGRSLNVKHVYLGNEDKITVLNKMMRETGLALEQIAYVGDELFDIPVLEVVGFSATVPGAVAEVKEVVHYITTEPGGHGAVREVADLIRKSVSER